MKSLNEVLAEVTTFIADHLKLPASTITDTSIIDDLTNDSIQLFELLIAFERHYNYETAYEEVLNMHTVGDIANYVYQNVPR